MNRTLTADQFSDVSAAASYMHAAIEQALKLPHQDRLKVLAEQKSFVQTLNARIEREMQP